jgi:hypothetical protein
MHRNLVEIEADAVISESDIGLIKSREDTPD